MSFDNKERKKCFTSKPGEKKICVPWKPGEKQIVFLENQEKKYPYMTRTYERSAQLREWAVLILAAFEAILRLFVKYYYVVN